MSNKNSDTATIREVYDLILRLETKIDAMKENISAKYVTKEEFHPVKKDVEILIRFRYWILGAAMIGSLLFTELRDILLKR